MRYLPDIVTLAASLVGEDRRAGAARELADLIGAEHVVFFVADPEINVLLAARGFPQILPEPTAWRAFLEKIQQTGRCDGPLTYLDQEEDHPCIGLGGPGAAIVLIGGAPDPATFEDILRLLPLISAVFSSEHIATNARAVSLLARNAVKGLREQAKSLEQTRRIASEDLRARRQAEMQLEAKAKELERSNEDLQQFAAVASHDLQEPLRMVTNYLSLVEHRAAKDLDEKARSHIAYAIDGATRMSKLIRALLEFAQVGTAERDFTMVPMEVVVREAIHNLSQRIADTKARVTVGEMPSLFGAHVLLVQLIQNLVGNAVKFSRPGLAPAVEVTAVRSGDVWEIAVADNGIGIDVLHLEKIFGVFKRLHRIDEYEGTGIGLATCRRIATIHHGRIWVESQKGVGSRFVVALPAS